jgi:hypothetical protein
MDQSMLKHGVIKDIHFVHISKKDYIAIQKNKY